MPNWCSNDLTISGPDVAKVLAFIRTEKYYESGDEDTEDLEFDFNKVVPYPENFKQMDARRREWDKKIQPLFGQTDYKEKLAELKKEFGLPENAVQFKDGFNSGGYEWCCQNWGTKWNACEVRVNGNQINFDTAWSPPIPVVEALAAKFPDHEFSLDSYECGAAFQCHVVWADGGRKSYDESVYRGNRGG